MKTLSLLRGLARFYPVRLREKGDFGGLMCGKLPHEVHTILLCLDYDDEVYPEALKLHPDLIITHHPFIFGTKHAVLESDPVKKDLYEKTEKAGPLPFIAFHTNFDTGHARHERRPGRKSSVYWTSGRSMAAPWPAEAAFPMKLCPVRDFRSCTRRRSSELPMDYAHRRRQTRRWRRSPSSEAAAGAKTNSPSQLGYDIYISGDIPASWPARDCPPSL
jgi:putative NIF3 family GTP cyclohydrolase 1 type 2